jgi:L-amino acid N-acyltransferase YncA
MTKDREFRGASSAVIRPAAGPDIPAITAIYAHHVRHGLASFEEVAPSEDGMRERFDEIRGKKLPYLMAVFADEIAGYAYASPYRMRSAYRFTLEDSVYLKAEATGQGIGKWLLSRLVEDSAALGYRQMIAVIGDSAHRPSIRLHQALGFSHVGILPSVGFKHGRWIDGVLMQRPLGDGDTTLPASEPR